MGPGRKVGAWMVGGGQGGSPVPILGGRAGGIQKGRKGKLTDVKYSKGWKWRRDGSFQEAAENRPWTSRRKVWARSCAIWAQVALQRKARPVILSIRGENLSMGESQSPVLPPTHGRDPSSDFLFLSGTRGSIQLRLPRHRPRRVGAVHPHSPKESRSQDLLPWSVPENWAWQNLPESCSCPTHQSTGAPRAGEGRTAE